MEKNKPIPPFRRFVLQNFPFIEEDFDALTNYELLCKIVEYLNKVIENENNLSSQMDYVLDYFNNLDVTEEINNKIDQMVEDGTLQALFSGNGLEIGIDGKVKVKAGEGITVNEDGVNVTPYQNYIQGVDVKTYHYTNAETGSDTTIYYSVIPADYIPKLVMADENNANVAKVPSDFDYKYKPTLMINASPWNTSTHETYGPLIIDGNIKVLNNLEDGTDTVRTIFAIAEDGTLSSINGTATADYVKTVAKSAGRAWHTVINNGIDLTPDMITDKDPRTFLAQGTDGTYVIGVCGGRTFDNTGMQVQDIAYFLINNIDGFVPRVAFNLDGGGSSTLNYKGIRQNPLVTFENRACPNYLVFSSPTAKDNGVFEAQSETNAGLIQNTKWNNTGYLDADGLRAIKHASMTISHGMLRQVNGFLTLLEFEFSTSEVIASYSKLLKHLPKSNMSSIQYFTIVKKASDQDSNNMLRQVYIQNTTSEDETCLINRFAMPAGDYIVNIVYASQP